MCVALSHALRDQTHACPLFPVQLTSCPRRYPENQRQRAEEHRNTINTARGGEKEEGENEPSGGKKRICMTESNGTEEKENEKKNGIINERKACKEFRNHTAHKLVR